MGASLSSIDNILKELYDDAITENQVNSHVLFTRWQSRVADVVINGKSFRMNCPLRTGRNQGIGARAEDTTLPAPGQTKYGNTTPTLSTIYGAIRLTGHALDASGGGNASAFADALDEEVNGMVQSMNLEMARYIMGDGTGALAQVNGVVTTAAAVVVDNPDTRWLEEGMFIDAWTSKTAGTQSVTNIEIVAIARATSTITLASNQTIADDSWIFRTGNHAVTQPMGLLGIVSDTGALQGIDPATAGNSYWKANLVTGGGTAKFSEQLIQQTIDETEINGAEARISVGLMDHTSRRWMFYVLSAQKRFVNIQSLKGGWSAITYEGGSDPIPFLADRLSWPGYTYLLDERGFMFGWAPKPGGQWMDRDGQILKLDQAARKDAYIAYRYTRWQLATKARRNQARLYGYITPVV